jgi:hypothetical protein
VSSYDRYDGETQLRQTVRQFPPSESLSSRVSFERRNGMKLACVQRALMQFDSARSEQLIFALSFRRTPVFVARSLPARSTRLGLPIGWRAARPGRASRPSTTIWQMSCEREETGLESVCACLRRLFPMWISPRTSAVVVG